MQSEKTGEGCEKTTITASSMQFLLGLDQVALEQALRKHRKQVLDAAGAQESADASGIEHIAIDGKTLRGSLARFADVAALQWLRAKYASSPVCLRSSGLWR
jgi:hypothetical protein